MNIVTENITARQHYEFGYFLYEAGHPITSCANFFQRRGWMAANAAEGEYVTPNYAQKAGF